ncbi:MAG: DUF4407 domain-containing protein [Bacteroidales bacterium]|nr:DUF4407 domain-containing protein [Bacteroidales bacterium]
MDKLSNKQIEIPHKYNLGPLYRFFCWCSGVRLYLLRSCPTDYNKFFGIGIIVFLTGIMASITGSYALFVIFDSIPLAIIFGIFWGILIFFLDWYIVASLKKEERFFSELMFSIPRIILAILLAIVISRPLELKLFEKEINGMLQSIQSENSIEYNKLTDTEFKQISELKQENETFINEIKKKEQLRNELFKMVIEEAEGRSPTSRIGKGNVYREKKAEYDKIDKELLELKQLNNNRIEQNKELIAQLETQKQTQLSKSNSEIKNADGLLARFEAMSALAEKNVTVKYASWFIFLLFVLIEASPIIVKLLSRRGPYDELIEKEEYEKQIEYKKQKIKAKVLANNYLELLKQKDELQLLSEKRNNENLVNEIEKAKDEINKLAVGHWKKKEIESLNKLVEKELNEQNHKVENMEETLEEENLDEEPVIEMENSEMQENGEQRSENEENENLN